MKLVLDKGESLLAFEDRVCDHLHLGEGLKGSSARHVRIGISAAGELAMSCIPRDTAIVMWTLYRRDYPQGVEIILITRTAGETLGQDLQPQVNELASRVRQRFDAWQVGCHGRRR